MDLSVTLLKRIRSYAGLKVFLYLAENSSSNNTIMISANRLSENSGVSRNSVKKALEELRADDLIKILSSSQEQTVFYVSKTDIAESDISKTDTPSDEQKEWKKAFGSKGSSESEQGNNIIINNNKDINKEDIVINILNTNFNNLDFVKEDINSVSVVNYNIYMTDEQLGKLARRVLVEWFLPLSKFKANNPKTFFPQQMKMIKDLLVKWRLEQVLASILYWTQVKPPRDGVKSIRWLMFENKRTSNMMIALDYYKADYVNNYSKEAMKEKGEKMKEIVEEQVKRIEEERQAVAEKTDEDFVSDLLGSFGTIKIDGS